MSIDILDYIENTDFIAEEIDGTVYYRSIEDVDSYHRDMNIKGAYVLGRERLSFDFKEADDGIIIRVLSDNAEGKEQKYTCKQILSKPRILNYLPTLRSKMFPYYRDQLKGKRIKMFTILDNLKSIELVDEIENRAIRTYQVETVYANKPISGTLILINPYYNYEKDIYIFISGDIYIKYLAEDNNGEYECWLNYIKHHPLLKGI